jgi:thioredoxin:protein disulfide reductase
MKLFVLVLSVMLASVAWAVSPDELLEPEKAFRISARALDERSVEVEFKIAKGYYMYRDRFSFASASGEPLGEAEIPRGVVKEDPFFGKTETFRDLVRIRVPLSAQEIEKRSVELKVTSQGCSDKGVCYTPLEQTVRVDLSQAGLPREGSSRTSAGYYLAAMPWMLVAAWLAGGLALGWAAAGAPLAADRTRRFAPLAVLLWTLFLGSAGALAGWLGLHLAAAAHPWLGAPLAIVYLVMAALWMHWSIHRGEFNWPVRAAREVALAAAVLLFVFYVGDLWVGAGAALGAGFAAVRFPKARTEGAHQPALQAVALVMLAAAAWVAAPLLPDVFRMFSWALWLIVAGTLLRAIDPLPAEASWFMRLAKAAGVGLLVWGVAVAIGAASGARDPLQPFAALRGGAARPAESPVRFERVASLAELEARIAAAGRPVMLDFYADWCVSCKEMEQFTFSDPQVRSRMERMLLLQVDVTRNTEDDKAILKRFRLFGPPGIIFFDPRGRELTQRVVGYQPPERFLRVLEAVLATEAT